MGNTFQKMVSNDPYPTDIIPTYDKQFGFSGNRKKRELNIPEEVLVAAKLPQSSRDYCVDILLEYKLCSLKTFPFVLGCADEISKYHDCQYQDYVLRMKEYERERRLLVREKRLKENLKAAAT